MLTFAMHREAHYWHSHRLGREMGVVVFGHFGPPMIACPTTGGDEWEYERNGVIGAMAGAIDGGRVKVFCVNTNNSDSFGNDRAHPRHRSWMQRQYDDYIRQEIVPFVRHHCQQDDIAIWTMGASLGGYHAVNTLLTFNENAITEFDRVNAAIAEVKGAKAQTSVDLDSAMRELETLAQRAKKLSA